MSLRDSSFSKIYIYKNRQKLFQPFVGQFFWSSEFTSVFVLLRNADAFTTNKGSLQKPRERSGMAKNTSWYEIKPVKNNFYFYWSVLNYTSEMQQVIREINENETGKRKGLKSLDENRMLFTFH